MSSTECHIDFWIGPHWLTGFRQNPTAYRCWFISLFSSGISGSVTSWLLPGSLPPTCRRLKNVRGYRSLLMITLLAQTLAVIQQLRHKPWTPTTTPRSWAVYLSSSMQWHWQSSWHLVTCGHVMAGVWNVNDETHHIWMSTQQNGYKRLGAACSLFQLRGEVERRSRSQPWEGWNFMSICQPSTTKQILMSAENGDQSGQLDNISIFIIKYLLFSFVVYNFI